MAMTVILAAAGCAAFGVLPLGSVRPDGWLRVQLEQQASGLTGHAEELYDDIGRSDWLTGGKRGGDCAWERGPYYAKGLVALAFALDDPALKAKAKRWIDALIASQRENGDFGPKNDNWWANMIALHYVRDWGEATGDARVIPFLGRYFAYQLKRLPEHPLSADAPWAVARGGDNLEVVLWLRARTGDVALDRLADLLIRQTSRWSDFYIGGGNGDWGHDGYRMHIVNFMQGFKFPALKWSVTGDVRERDACRAAFDADGWAMRQHGRVDRMLNGTEPLSGREAGQGTELCAVAERILSTRDVIAVTRCDAYADDLESVAYNSLPSHLGDDGRGLRYYSLLNQPSCRMRMKLGFENNGGGDAFTPGPDSGYGCCRSNFHFAWPKFVQSMWMADGDGLRAIAYGPCTVSNDFCTIEERGDYPFGDRVTFRVLRSDGREWTLRLRKPGWCTKMSVKLNGEVASGDTSIRRAWRAGDMVELEMPCDVTVEKGNVYDSVALRRGALVYVLAPEAEIKTLATPTNRVGFPVREYTPKGRWNYALRLNDDGRTIAADFVPPKDLSGNVFAHGRAVSAVKVRASRTDYAGWGTYRAGGHNNGRAIEPPPSPLTPLQHAADEETLTLVPMGASQIRITLFPWYR